MKTKPIFLALLAVVVAGKIGVVLVAHRHRAEPSSTQTAAIPTTIETAVPAETAAAAPPVSAPEKIAEVSLPQKKSPAVSAAKKQNSNSGPKLKEPIQDPDARAALSLVGADPAAEQYWTTAINDPNLPANERKDLIEDLNEDGLSDPKHPGSQDLLLILSRIQLIEQLAPASMDQVNADAFHEAYKDLVNLASGGTAQ